jgi:hypothetical protein
MTILILFFAMLAILALGAALGRTPDTHHQVSQHGHYKF